MGKKNQERWQFLKRKGIKVQSIRRLSSEDKDGTQARDTFWMQKEGLIKLQAKRKLQVA